MTNKINDFINSRIAQKHKTCFTAYLIIHIAYAKSVLSIKSLPL